jgi:2-dehydropantoate 2-reductase
MPAGEWLTKPPVVTSVTDLQWQDGDVALLAVKSVALLAVKSQDTDGVLTELAAVAPADTPIVCLQNGVANEPAALRRFANVYAVPVLCPCGHLEPGVVEAYGLRTVGIVDVGRYPSGSDRVAGEISAAFRLAGYESVVRDDVQRWKWAKLITNLANAVEAVCGLGPDARPVLKAVRLEGQACLDAAGIDAASREEDQERRGDLLELGDIGDSPRLGGSTWQSLARSASAVETDYLTGEVILLGRLHGVPTPVNETLQRLVRQMLRDHVPPASMPVEQVLAELG